MEINTKKCCRCKLYKSLDLFYKNKSKNDGYSTECKDCDKNRYGYFKEYRKSNVEKIKNKGKRYYAKNKDAILENSRLRYANNPDLKRNYVKNNRSKINERVNKNRKNNIALRLRHNVSCAIRQAFNKTYSIKNSPTWSKLPYTPQQLKVHLESQFDSNMSWDNYGIYWVIDHICPQSKLIYDSLNHPNFYKCWALDNLRPLEITENIKKGDRWEATLMN